MLYKIIEKGTRGTAIGVYNFSSSIGVLIISRLGSFLFEKIDIQAPFILVGLLDVLFIILIIVLKSTGKLKL